MSSSFKPTGWPTLIPRIFTDDIDGLVGFLAEVFGARAEHHEGAPTEVWIDRSMLMVSDGGGLRAPSAAFTYVYVPDIDDAYQRAAAAGATSVEAPRDMPYGDRRATVQDAWGNTWQIATRH